MAFVYVFSRVPQIYKSLSTKDLADLSLKMFLGTFLGNATQMLSMVIMHVKYLNKEYFKRSAPWILNAGLCALQDLFIICLIIKYGTNDETGKSTELQPLLTPGNMPLSYKSDSRKMVRCPSGGNDEGFLQSQYEEA